MDGVTVKAILLGCSQQSALFEPHVGYLPEGKRTLPKLVDPGQIIMNKRAGVATPEKMSDEQWVQEQEIQKTSHNSLS